MSNYDVSKLEPNRTELSTHLLLSKSRCFLHLDLRTKLVYNLSSASCFVSVPPIQSTLFYYLGIFYCRIWIAWVLTALCSSACHYVTSFLLGSKAIRCASNFRTEGESQPCKQAVNSIRALDLSYHVDGCVCGNRITNILWSSQKIGIYSGSYSVFRVWVSIRMRNFS